MDDYISKNKGEIYENIAGEYGEMGADMELELCQAEMMGYGETAIGLKLEVSLGSQNLTQDFLLTNKNNTLFVLLVQKLNDQNTRDEIEYLSKT
jgi:hypothetical protein